MRNLILAAFGIGIAVTAAVFLIKNLILKNKGERVLAEVAAVDKEMRRSFSAGKNAKAANGYIHTLSYEANGKTYKAKDKTCYNQPFSVGSKKTIVCDRHSPEKFEYAEQLDRNITLFGSLAVMGIVFAIKFLMSSNIF